MSSDLRAEIEHCVNQFMATFKAGDAAGLAEFYSSDAQLLPPDSDFILGQEAIQAYWQAVMEMGLADDLFINKKQLSLRFCNFNRLYNMINTDPRLGVVLPCRITVVEQPEGDVKLYVMNMRLVSRLFNNDQLDESAISMFESVIEVIEEATL